MAASREELERLATDVFTLGVEVDNAVKSIQKAQVDFRECVEVQFAQYKLGVEHVVQLAKNEFEAQRNGTQGVNNFLTSP